MGQIAIACTTLPSAARVSDEERGEYACALQCPMSDAPHSAQFLTDARDLWWNLDHLQLVARRLQLDAVRAAVDVGSGLGHWTRTIARVLPPQCTLVGVEREAAWVARCQATSNAANLRFTLGRAEQLPFDDASLDLVTCQTLLIHVQDPAQVLAEFARVLKPGGVLLAAEPNNFAGSMVSFAGEDVDDAVAAFRLEITCERGKRALGLGDNSLGERLVGLLRAPAWRDVNAWMCDKTRPAHAPYSDEARTLFADEQRQFDSGAVGWSKAETERYFAAGGGDAAQFEPLWAAARALLARRLQAFDDGNYAGAEGSLMYLVAARRR